MYKPLSIIIKLFNFTKSNIINQRRNLEAQYGITFDSCTPIKYFSNNNLENYYYIYYLKESYKLCKIRKEKSDKHFSNLYNDIVMNEGTCSIYFNLLLNGSEDKIKMIDSYKDLRLSCDKDELKESNSKNLSMNIDLLTNFIINYNLDPPLYSFIVAIGDFYIDPLLKEIKEFSDATKSEGLFLNIQTNYGKLSVETLLLSWFLILKPAHLNIEYSEGNIISESYIKLDKFKEYLLSIDYKNVDNFNLMKLRKYNINFENLCNVLFSFLECTDYYKRRLLNLERS